MKELWTVAIWACGACLAQTAPMFEAASLRPMDAVRSPRLEGGPGTSDPGRIRFSGITPRYLILEAYRIRNFQLTAADSKALDNRGYELTAKLPPGASEADLRLMLRSLLESRFHLAVRHERRVMQGYELSLAKSGPKLQPSAAAADRSRDFDPLPPAPPNELEVHADGYPNVPPREGSWMVVLRSGFARMRQLHATMEDLAGMLSNQLERPVTDRTGLRGAFAFTLSWTSGVPAAGAEPQPDLFGALQQQLGLKLAPWRGPVEVVVIDRLDREPTKTEPPIGGETNMTWLELWTQTAMAKALAAALLHSLWQGSLAAILLSAALRVTRSPQTRYAAALLALGATLGTFLATLAILWPASAGAAAAHSLIRLPESISPEPDAGVLAGAWRFSDWAPWLAPLWIAGAIAFQLRAAAGWFGVRRLRNAGVCAAPLEWRRRLCYLAARLRVSRPVKLLESSLAEAPVVMGHFRPVILVPLGLLAGLPPEQVEAILAHELAHIARQDYLVNLLQTFVEGLLFYHPAVWWMARVIRAEREHCCDDVAVALSGDARGYAAALTMLEQNRMAARELALAATGGNLVKRVRRILQTPELPRAGWSSLATAALTLALAVGLAAWQKASVASAATPVVSAAAANPQSPSISQPAAAAQSPLPPSAPPASPQTSADAPARLAPGSPYRKWLNEDVAYIITDQERKDFKALATDTERESFIEQFWLRRDPTPGTAENEFKSEHYRRIAFANEHFASEVPGWKTDRGRIYIVFGPPDEIEDHSAGGEYQRPPEQGGGKITTVPFQQWRYRYIQGVGTNVIIEFIDPEGKNEYRMTSDPSAKDASKYSAALTPPRNSFISAGGDPQVKVTVGAGGFMNYQIEQDAMVGRWTYKATVTNSGKIATNAGVKDIGPSSLGTRLTLNGYFTLEPGAYTLHIEVKDPAGVTRTKAVDFYAN